MTDNQQSTISNRELIGYIVGGGLKENLHARLEIPAQDVQEGAFITIDSNDWIFYGLVTDLQLGSTDPRFADEQSQTRLPPNLSKLLHGQTLFTNLEVLPALMMERGPEPGSPEYKNWTSEIDAGLRDQPRPLPVKTIPPHHAEVRLAGPGDIAEIFGIPGEKGNFIIGETREQGHPVVINMEKFVQRSSGVFGATGTGKSFLTRLVLAGLIQYDAASVLVLDMHNEYGFDDTASDTGEKVTGLKSKFSAKVRVVGLGAGATIRGQMPDFNLEIAMSDIQPSDIELLTRELNLKETTPTTLEALLASFGPDWFQTFKDMKVGAMIENEEGKRVPAPDSVAAWANQHGVNVMAAEGLHNKLRRVFNLSYIVPEPASDTIGEIVKALEAGQHIVLSFGKHEADLDYLLVSNLLTRRIRQVWEERTNDFRSSGKGEPRPLVIVVEEAHKLLNREMAAQTTFSTIARELRKYYVTLLIVDQRPSQIYDEVMSQLGTRVSGWLGDDDDIRAVLSGLAGREALRGMLARLQPKEEVLLLGWGVPMPLPVRSRRYDERFWEELLGKKGGKKSEAQAKKELGFNNLKMASLGYISNIFENLLEPIFVLVSALENTEPGIPNEVQTNPVENGYSCGIASLAVTLFETGINRTKYRKGDDVNLKSVPYLRDLTANQELADRIDEIYSVRDAIIHNHLWEAEIDWNEDGNLIFVTEPTLAGGYGNNRLQRVMNPENRQTKILSLNLAPTRIWRRDAYLVLRTVGEGLKAIENVDINYVSISNSHIHFNNQLLTFDQIVDTLDIPDLI